MSTPTQNEAAPSSAFPFEPSRILRQARRLCSSDEHAAEDLAQEFFLRTLGADVPLIRSPYMWSQAVLANLARNQWSRNRKTCDLHCSGPLPDTRVSSPDIALERAQCIAGLRERLARLPDHQRHALELTYLEGLSLSDAALRQGVAYSTMRNRRSRGLRQLRTLLADSHLEYGALRYP